MINKELISNKMSDIEGYLQELNLVIQEDSRKIIEDNLKLRTVERLFQLIADTAIDINTHIISESGFSIPDDYQNTFMVLAENGILTKEFSLKIAPSVGLRNLIVHKYGRVDVKKMVDDIKNEVGEYKEYLGHVDDFLKREV